MEGQMSLFPEAKKRSAKAKKKAKKIVERKPVDLSQEFDKRMERFLHYMDIKGMNEKWIETCFGELRIIVDSLADYCDIINGHIEGLEDGYAKATWMDRIERIGQIQGKLEQSIGYSRDKQLEECMKRKAKKEDDIGEDALVLAARRGK